MKTIHDQRIYIGTTGAEYLADQLDLTVDGVVNYDEGPDAFVTGPEQLTLKAGEDVLAIIVNNRWASELVELLETFHAREQKYLDEIARLSDEVGALTLEQSQARVLNEVRQRLGAV